MPLQDRKKSVLLDQNPPQLHLLVNRSTFWDPECTGAHEEPPVAPLSLRSQSCFLASPVFSAPHLQLFPTQPGLVVLGPGHERLWQCPRHRTVHLKAGLQGPLRRVY
ncbi:hypothetical protein Mapa_011819 [Marchantia paleacea]|nr:hypothetical protein Mapa_011819 [Marchantia paleacea]